MNKIKKILKHPLRLLGLDTATLALLAFRIWTMVSGAVVVFLIPFWLSPSQQGYFYTFSSLFMLNMLFELGLGQVIVQFVSHEYALMGGDKHNPIPDKNSPHLSRLISLFHLLHRWYATVAVLFFLLVGTAGTVFFASKGTLPFRAWLGPWLLLVLATAGNLYLGSRLVVLQGCGKIAEVSKIQLTQAVAGSVLTWVFFSLGAGLWAAACTPFVTLIHTLWWLLKKDTLLQTFQRIAFAKGSTSKVHWRSEILQVQWRIAISWISGYFISQLFTPLAFAHEGAVAAGQLGITLTAFTALTGASMSWVAAKNPLMGQYIALGQRESLNAVFRLVLSRSVGVALLGTVGILSLLALGKSLDLPLTKRFASLDVAACLAVVTLANSFVLTASAYLRAHRKEPLLCSSITIGILTTLASAISVRHGVLPMMIAYALITVCVAVPWTLCLFWPVYRRTQ